MAKNLVIRKHKDKIVLKMNGVQVADIIVAESSRSSSVNLSIQSPSQVIIQKVVRS